jgi:hypothetical protein
MLAAVDAPGKLELDQDVEGFGNEALIDSQFAGQAGGLAAMNARRF